MTLTLNKGYNVKCEEMTFLAGNSKCTIRRRRLRSSAGSKVEAQQEEGRGRSRSVRTSSERAYHDYSLGSGEQLQMSE